MENQILTTTDYSKFKKLQGNRGVEEIRVKSLMDSIKQVGWISNPIIVNRKMEVVDGQGRLEALRRLNLPVEYHVVDDADLKACRVMNTNNRSWRPLDYIKSYAESGIKDYQRVYQLMMYFGVKVDTVLNSVFITTSGNTSQRTKRGELIFSEHDYVKASEALNIRKKYVKAMDRFGGRRDTRDKVVFYIVDYGRSHPEVDHDAIVKALESADPHEIYAQNFERLLESVQNAYNKGKKKNRLYFYEEYRIDNKVS